MRQGVTITPYYDPMIAKMIAWGEDRAAALARMLAALQVSRIEGVKNNLEFLKAVLRQGDFVAGRLDTGLIDRERARLLDAMAAAPAGGR